MPIGRQRYMYEMNMPESSGRQNRAILSDMIQDILINPMLGLQVLLCLFPEYESAVLFPFFDGLIPEGWLLDIASRNWKLDKNDRFGLLIACCRDCIGDVSVREVSDEV